MKNKHKEGLTEKSEILIYIIFEVNYMQYMFSGVVLGDFTIANEYFGEAGFQNITEASLIQWQSQCILQDNEIEISIDVPIKNDVNFDEILQMADCILYFLNPNNPEEFLIFEDIVDIINGLQREIPCFIIIRDNQKSCSFSSNEILYKIWQLSNYDPFFANFGTINFLPYIIEKMCFNLINASPFINIELAWLKLPFLYRQIDQEIALKKWKSAAKIAEIIANIKKELNYHDWQIAAEIASKLYAKNKNFLKSAKIINSFNPRLASKFRHDYVENLLENAQILMEKQDYVAAAEKFENAANWAKMELNDNDLIKKSYRLAISSWVAACEIQNAFSLLELFDHDVMVSILEDITDDVAVMVDNLVSKGQVEYAKSQLYLCFQRYQKAGLFESMKVLTKKVVKLLKQIIDTQIQENDVYSAKMTLDELYNIWDTYELPSENIDKILYRMGKIFVEKHDFQKVEVLIPKIESSKLQEELTQYRMNVEEKIKENLSSKEILELHENFDVLTHYIQQEKLIISNYLKSLYASVSPLFDKQDYNNVVKIFKQNMIRFKNIGEINAADEIFDHILQIYIDYNLIRPFITDIENFTENRRKEFLQRNFSVIRENIEQNLSKFDSQEYDQIISLIIKLYRNHLLYTESQSLSEEFIKNLILQAKYYANKRSYETIVQSLSIIQRVHDISLSYLDGKSFNFDEIYAPIVEFYIKEKDLEKAQVFNEKISKASINSVFYGQIEAILSSESKEVAMKAQEEQEMKMFIDQLSQLKTLARDYRMATENILRMRTGLMKRYFQQGLDLIANKDLESAAQYYFENAFKLADTKKFELAGISVAVGLILYIYEKSFSILNISYKKLKKDLGSSKVIFEKGFSVKVCDFIISMIERNKPQHMLEGIKLFEFIALYPEEMVFVQKLIGEEMDFQESIQKFSARLNPDQIQIPSNYYTIIEKIEFSAPQINKRKQIESKYWDICQDLFTRQEYEQASVEYLNLVDDLIFRNFDQFVYVSILMSFISLIKVKPTSYVYEQYEKYVFTKGKSNEELFKTPIISLFDLCLQYWDIPKASLMVQDIIQAFIEKLPLFDWEISFISNISSSLGNESSSSATLDSNETITTQDSKDFIDENSLLFQQITVLTQEITGMEEELSQLLYKRSKMINTYYSDIIKDIQSRNFEDASEQYIKLSTRMARRNDFNSSSLMLLLSVLSKLKQNLSIDTIKNDLDTVLGKLGIVKKILDDHFGVKLAYFILDFLKGQFKSDSQQLTNILQKLPLLPDEKVLICFE